MNWCDLYKDSYFIPKTEFCPLLKYNSKGQNRLSSAKSNSRAIFGSTLKPFSMKESKKNDNNQKPFDQMVNMSLMGKRLLVERQASKDEYAQYCITAKKASLGR